MFTLTSYTLSIPKSIYTLGQRSRFCHTFESLHTVCISLYSVSNELGGRMRIAPIYASRTMCESHFIVRVALCAVALYSAPPLPPSPPPHKNKRFDCAANINIHRRLDLMKLLILARLADIDIYIDCKILICRLLYKSRVGNASFVTDCRGPMCKTWHHL